MTPASQAALRHLVETLRQREYRFITPTPATHRRVVSRPEKQIAATIEDVFGWSLPFLRDMLEQDLFQALAEAQLLETMGGGMYRSLARLSSLDGDLYAHSAFPTEKEDAVFFGPDSYRFAALIQAELIDHGRAVRSIVDIGTGAGVGAIVAAKRWTAARVIGTDINPRALEFAQVNAALAGVALETIVTGSLASLPEPIDLALANPPYIVDDSKRAYRDGGGMHGAEVALDMARDAVGRLAPGGRLILYTGSAIVGGNDSLRAALDALSRTAGCAMRYWEIDPDVFGEELENDAYRDVDRIAVVAAVLTAPG